MAITTLDFPKLTDDLESIFAEFARTNLADAVGMQLFDVQDTDRKTFEHLILHGQDGIKKVAEGADLPLAGNSEGDTIIYTQSRFGSLVSITKDMRIFDLHNQIQGLVRSVTQDAFDKIDQSMADVLLQGQNTTYTDVYGVTITATGPDGLALFSTAHTNGATGTTFSNIINDGTVSNPALTRVAIVEQRARSRRYTDPNGLTRPVRLDTLIVGPGQEDLANRIINSELIQGTANNDTNSSLRSIQVVVWDRLDLAADGTDTSAFWFMADSRKMGETLKAIFAQKPMLMAPDEVYKNKNWDYSLDFYYVLGIGFAPYVVGSDASLT